MKKIISYLSIFLLAITSVKAQSILLTPSNGVNMSVNSQFLRLQGSTQPNLFMNRSTGTLASPSATLTNMYLGRILGGGYNGTSWVDAAATMDFVSVGSWSSTARGSYIRFSTTKEETTALTERMRILDSGEVGIGTSSPGTTLDVYANEADKGINISKGGSGFGSTRLSYWSDRGAANEWRPGYIASGDNGSFTGRLDFFTNGSGISSKVGTVRGMSLVDNKLLVGNSAFGELNPEYRLQVIGSDVGSPLNGAGGLLGIGKNNGGHISMTTSSIDSWFNTNGTYLNLNFYSKGIVRIGSSGDGDLEVNGFTQLGSGSSVPKVKMKKIFGTTNAGSATTSISHGLTRDKILAVDIHVSNGSGVNYPPSGNALGPVENQYRYFINSAVITLANLGAEQQGQSYWILITYEE